MQKISLLYIMLKNISHWGDIIAIPFFLLLCIYFYQIRNRNLIENILFLFSIVALMMDILFTYLFFASSTCS